jgi:hypothetical protein
MKSADILGGQAALCQHPEYETSDQQTEGNPGFEMVEYSGKNMSVGARFVAPWTRAPTWAP